MAKKSCKKGYYYCYASKKCKKIPMGYVVGMGGWLRKEKEEDETEGKKKNGNGNGANGDGNGNGGSDGGSNGGGVSESWSAKYKKSIDCNNPKGFSQRAHCQGRKKVNEATMSSAQKRKDTMLKKKYDKSDMKQNMIDQYGKEEGTKIYFATIRKQAMKEEKKGDHEISMAQSQLKKSERNIKKLRKALGTKERDIPAWVQAKITDTEHNTDAAAGYMEEGKRDGKSAKDKGYSLRDWFKGGGWVQAGGKYDGKPCARQPGQKTKPFCRDADDRANMSKKERSRRAAKKRREDPNPDRKGKAKMVTDNYSNWRNELQLDEGMGLGLAAGAAALLAAPYLAKKLLKPKVDKAIDKQRKTAPIGGDRRVPQLEGRYSGGGGLRPTDRIKMGDGSLKSLKDIDAKLKEKGVKKVVSEYAEGGGSAPQASAKVSKFVDELPKKVRKAIKSIPPGYSIKGKEIQINSHEPEGEVVSEKKDACYHKVKSRYSVWPSAYASGALVKCRKVGAKNWGNKTKKEGYEFSNWRDNFQAMDVESVDIIKAEPLQPTKGIGSDMLGEAKKCWKGYEKKGTQKLFGKTYNRCVKKESFSNWREELSEEGVDVLKDKKRGSEPKSKSSSDYKNPYGLKGIGPGIRGQIKLANSYESEGELIEDWQKVNRKDKTDGMSQKAVNAYKRENPGSKLKTAVTEKNPTGKRAERRKSFCARSNGQRKMHNIDCSKTPEKKICKARKRWRC